ncbi:hypothetical protein DFH09DRAFT_1283740 [Mycena vulgaris]|nr:hypothetical protein DFH09DRAFT_1283740 [Mycena vulgaris]
MMATAAVRKRLAELEAQIVEQKLVLDELLISRAVACKSTSGQTKKLHSKLTALLCPPGRPFRHRIMFNPVFHLQIWSGGSMSANMPASPYLYTSTLFSAITMAWPHPYLPISNP